MRDSRPLTRIMLVATLLLLPVFAFLLKIPHGYAAALPAEETSWFINMNRFGDSAHATIPCEECHKDLTGDEQTHPDPKEKTFLKADATRTYDYSQCKSCHRASYERYRLGAHAKVLEKEHKGQGQLTKTGRAPTCGDCHSGHYARSHLSRVETGRQMTAVCGSCHRPQLVTYLDNYHGKAAVNLKDPDSAYCTDCHGAHECVSLKDKEVALGACQRCHPDAGKSFAQFVIHPVTEDAPPEDQTEADLQKKERVALVRVITAVMGILVLFVVCFFYGHTFVWLLRELHEKLRKHGS
ncbi:MAG: multiheme c-type cytochrome [Thermodesulfobacteriota bacterium]